MPREEYEQLRARFAEAHRLQDLEAAWSHAGVPDRHRDSLGLRESSDGPWRQRYDSLKTLLPEGFLLALLGIRGNGKTQMGVCLIRDACELGLTARYIKALDLFRIIRSCFTDGGPDELATVRQFQNYGLLVIDEAHERGHTDFENRTLVNIIDHRYDGMKSTLLISNETKEQFAASVGPSIVSRLHETGGAFVCGWPSFRTPQRSATI